MDFCETHGLDLPCKKCMDERHEEIAYLNSIEEAMHYQKEDNMKKGGEEA